MKHLFSKYILPEKKYFIFLIIVSLFSAIFILLGDYLFIHKTEKYLFISIFIHWSLVSFAYGTLIYLLSLNRWIFIVVFPLLNLLSAIIIYYVFFFKISINVAIVESVFNTNSEEISSLVSAKLYIYIVSIFLISLGFAIYRFRKIKIKKIKIHIIFVLIGVFISISINTLHKKSITHRVPFSVYDALKDYIKKQNLINADRNEINQNSFSNVDSLTVVFVIGESARYDHLSLNGYERETCPNLSKKNVISFDKIYSPWTYTNASLLYILTRANSQDSLPMYKEKSLVSIFKKCKFKTYWLGNQTVGDIAPFVENCDTVVLNRKYQNSFNYNKLLDEELLPHLECFIDEKQPLKLIIIHLIGSHWYYPTHYPDSFEVFKPVMTNKILNLENNNKIINSYDNTILYTDYILSEVIDKIKNINSVMFYLSDHGELFGENGKWLHSYGTEEVV